MGYLKNVEINRNFMDDNRPWVKVARGIILTIAMIALIGFMIKMNFTDTQTAPPESKYDVKVSNVIGHRWYSCDSYKQEDNTYKLYNAKGVLTNEITITDGYLIEIQKNK